MELWDNIKYEVEARIPTNDWMFWRTDFWWLLSMPAWPFLLSLAITTDFPVWQLVFGVLTATVVMLWGAVILRVRKHKKQNWVESSRYADRDAGGGF